MMVFTLHMSDTDLNLARKRVAELEAIEAQRVKEMEKEKNVENTAILRRKIEPWADKHGVQILHVDNAYHANKQYNEIRNLVEDDWGGRCYFQDDFSGDMTRYRNDKNIPCKFLFNFQVA
jgi:hypothetical protein